MPAPRLFRCGDTLYRKSNGGKYTVINFYLLPMDPEAGVNYELRSARKEAWSGSQAELMNEFSVNPPSEELPANTPAFKLEDELIEVSSQRRFKVAEIEERTPGAYYYVLKGVTIEGSEWRGNQGALLHRFRLPKPGDTFPSPKPPPTQAPPPPDAVKFPAMLPDYAPAPCTVSNGSVAIAQIIEIEDTIHVVDTQGGLWVAHHDCFYGKGMQGPVKLIRREVLIENEGGQ